MVVTACATNIGFASALRPTQAGLHLPSDAFCRDNLADVPLAGLRTGNGNSAAKTAVQHRHSGIPKHFGFVPPR